MSWSSAIQTLKNKTLDTCTLVNTTLLGLVLTNTRKPVVVYTADGAVTVTNDIAVISKAGSAAAMTLAAPTAGQEGHELTLIAGTAFAHVITATDLIDDGVTGGAKDTITLGAFVGASATLIAYNLKWVLKSKTVATVAGS